MTVLSADTIVIDPGVVVKFALGVSMTVNGILIAVGNSSDSIRFTTAEPNTASGQWGRIIFSDTLTRPVSSFDYVIIEYGGGSFVNGVIRGAPTTILAEARNVRITYALIQHNDSGLYLHGDGGVALSNSLLRNNANYALIGRNIVVSNVLFLSNSGFYAGVVGSGTAFIKCTFQQNSPMAYLLFDSHSTTSFQSCLIQSNQAGIGSCYVDDTLFVDSCIVRNNGGPRINGNALYSPGVLLVRHSIITANSGAGITNASQGSIIESNSIAGNAAGITSIVGDTAMRIRNNIITASAGQGLQTSVSPAPSIRFNDVFNNNPDFSGFSVFFGDVSLKVNRNGTPADLYLNIRRNPLFINPALPDYHLQPTSPCIDAGDTLLTDLDGSVSDIGALSFPHATSVASGDIDARVRAVTELP